jgi:hypothetical protein
MLEPRRSPGRGPVHDKKLNRPALIFCVLVLSAMSLSALAAARVHLYGFDAFGIPLEFALFASTLLGIAVRHHHTLAVALTDPGGITASKLLFTGFKFGPGFHRQSMHQRKPQIICRSAVA